MKIYYRMGKTENSRNRIPTNYNACCEQNMQDVFNGELQIGNPIPEFNIEIGICFKDFRINYCPHCGALIEFIKE